MLYLLLRSIFSKGLRCCPCLELHETQHVNSNYQHVFVCLSVCVCNIIFVAYAFLNHFSMSNGVSYPSCKQWSSSCRNRNLASLYFSVYYVNIAKIFFLTIDKNSWFPEVDKCRSLECMIRNATACKLYSVSLLLYILMSFFSQSFYIYRNFSRFITNLLFNFISF